MQKPLQSYEAPGVTVTFDPNICQHRGMCTRPALGIRRRAQTLGATRARHSRGSSGAGGPVPVRSPSVPVDADPSRRCELTTL